MRIDGENFTKLHMKKGVMLSGMHLWIATDVLTRCCNVRNADSRHPAYSRAKTVLEELANEGLLQRRHFPSANLTVFWKIP